MPPPHFFTPPCSSQSDSAYSSSDRVKFSETLHARQPYANDVLTANIHQFFRQLAENTAAACMLGGHAMLSPQNSWVIIGIGARQKVQLAGNALTHQHPDGTKTIIPLQSPEDLFSQLEIIRNGCDSFDFESDSVDSGAFNHNNTPQNSDDTDINLPLRGGLIVQTAYDFYQWCDPAWAERLKSLEWDKTGETVLNAIEFKHWLILNLDPTASSVNHGNWPRWTVLTRDPQFKTDTETRWQEVIRDPATSENKWTTTTAKKNTSTSPDETLETYLSTFTPSLSQDAFAARVSRIQDKISAGELYQANLSVAFEKAMAIDPFAVFKALSFSNPSPYSGLLKIDNDFTVSNSPELLIQLSETGKLETRPIAGTRGRGQSPAEDQAVGERLMANPKERAEHLMLVDLARNDLGRVSQAGSVTVKELLVLERYSHVTHLVSHVTGQKKKQKSLWEVLQAVFPCGTITGCPKIRCINTLKQLEPVSRQVYTGGLGYINARSEAMAFNILIRTVSFKADKKSTGRYIVSANAGAGIVDGAIAAHEYKECLRKATAMLRVLKELEH
ncbi:MAG: anthranilate synthase component I family protein [Cyanobacteria bacterium P01_H01_bin.74]